MFTKTRTKEKRYLKSSPAKKNVHLNAVGVFII